MWHFHVVTDPVAKQHMAEIVTNKLEILAAKISLNKEQIKPLIKVSTFFVGAPAVIVVTTSVYRSKTDKILEMAGYSDLEIDVLRGRPDLQSIGAVIQTLLLAAWEKGYGTCWMTGPCVARPELEKYLGIVAPRNLAAVIPIGKPEVVPTSRGRNGIENILTFM